LDDLILSVDNNDNYPVSYGVNGTDFAELLRILVSDGEIGGGMDTMSLIVGQSDYVLGIDFQPVAARYLRISALVGGMA
jgi:hypothetical protein